MKNKLSKLAVATLLSLTAVSANAASYTITQLGGNDGYAYAMNNVGQAVGHSSIAHGATIWNGVELTSLGTLGGTFGAAYSINDLGQVVGFTDNALGERRAALWTGNGAVATDLGGGIALGINNAGQIVGESNGAALWNGGVWTSLGEGAATAINNLGQIVGVRNGDAFLWSNGVETDLGAVGAIGGANDINDLGQIVGRMNDHATVWNGGVATDLGIGSAFGINNSGQIVGESNNHAIVWNDGVATDLNSLLDSTALGAGWVLMVARGVNESGLIVGHGYNNLSGGMVGFVLTPVPEADTSAMMLMGVGLMGFIVRREKYKFL